MIYRHEHSLGTSCAIRVGSRGAGEGAAPGFRPRVRLLRELRGQRHRAALLHSASCRAGGRRGLPPRGRCRVESESPVRVGHQPRWVPPAVRAAGPGHARPGDVVALMGEPAACAPVARQPGGAANPGVAERRGDVRPRGTTGGDRASRSRRRALSIGQQQRGSVSARSGQCRDIDAHLTRRRAGAKRHHAGGSGSPAAGRP